MMKFAVATLFAVLLFALAGCESSSGGGGKSLPSRQTDGGTLPQARPASWEGGLPGMGGMGGGGATPGRY